MRSACSASERMRPCARHWWSSSRACRPLARRLLPRRSRAISGFPLVSRDKIKERLYDTLGVGDLEWAGRLGGAAFALLFDSARLMIESGHSVMLEANFFRGTEQEFSA